MKKILKRITAIKSLDELSAAELANFIKLLITYEEEPGGPYSFDKSDNPALLNDCIYRLFAAKGKLLNPKMLIGSLESSPVTIVSKHEEDTRPLYEQVHKTLKQFRNNDAINILNKIEETDSLGEISKLTSIFYDSLKKELSTPLQISPETIKHYSLANIYTWLAYSLVDKVLDTEYGPSLLPIISTVQRQIFNEYLQSGVDLDITEKLFMKVDSANIKELELRKRMAVDSLKKKVIIHGNDFSESEKLMSEKSIAHALGPINLSGLISKKFEPKIERAMSLYCSSRQLNDDLHDWLEDFSNGQPTFVIGQLLGEIKISSGTYDLPDLVADLKNAYWENVLNLCCTKIEADIQLAVDIFEETILEKNSNFVNLFLLPIAAAATKAREKHIYEKTFLRNMAL